MKKNLLLFALFAIFAFIAVACNQTEPNRTPGNTPAPDSTPSPTATSGQLPEGGLTYVEETHLANIKQLTFGGENAEAYWSGDGKQLILQSTHGDYKCDQIFTVNVEDSKEMKLVSTGKGRTTCSYFFPDGKKIIFASTHAAKADCPPPPDFSQGYVWPINPDYDIYVANPDGSDLKTLAKSSGYDAEATISPDGKKIVFTSTRDGDLDLYIMDADGSNVKRLTDDPGYDGGAFFSPDGKQLVYRAYHPTGDDLTQYQDLLKKNLVKPSKMEIFIMNADGSEKRQLTTIGKANFCPFFTPDGQRVIFSSNHADLDPKGRNFDLFVVSAEDGTNMKRITYSPGFDGFPMFSPDGKKLVWASNRNAKARGETNVFVADWVE